MAELKRCPFCNGDAFIYIQKSRYNNFCFVQCDTCSARSRVARTGYDEFEDAFFESDACDRVVRAWNRRAEDGK